MEEHASHRRTCDIGVCPHVTQGEINLAKGSAIQKKYNEGWRHVALNAFFEQGMAVDGCHIELRYYQINGPVLGVRANQVHAQDANFIKKRKGQANTNTLIN